MIGSRHFHPLLFAVVLLFSACHTIHPTAFPDSALLKQIRTTNHTIALVMDDQFRTHKSHDRGHPLADPQTYYVGEAMTPLTRSYFEKAFSKVTTMAVFPSHPHQVQQDYVIRVTLIDFDNKISSNMDDTSDIFLRLIPVE